jgi:hypothetical protein
MSFALAGRLAVAQRWVDPLTARLQPLIRQAVSPRPARNFLDGVWLGTPLHPALTTSRSAPKSGELCTLADTCTPLGGPLAEGDARATRSSALGTAHAATCTRAPSSACRLSDS